MPLPRHRGPANQAACGPVSNGTFRGVLRPPPTRFDDVKGKKIRGTDAGFRWIPNGILIETRMPLLFSHGVLDGRITINHSVALTATAPRAFMGFTRAKASSSAPTPTWRFGIVKPYSATKTFTTMSTTPLMKALP